MSSANGNGIRWKPPGSLHPPASIFSFYSAKWSLSSCFTLVWRRTTNLREHSAKYRRRTSSEQRQHQSDLILLGHRLDQRTDRPFTPCVRLLSTFQLFHGWTESETSTYHFVGIDEVRMLDIVLEEKLIPVFEP